MQKQCEKLLEGRINLTDCIFAKTFRGFKGYKEKAVVPSLEIAKLELEERLGWEDERRGEEMRGDIY